MCLLGGSVQYGFRFGRGSGSVGLGFPQAAVMYTAVWLNLTSTYLTKRLSEEERERYAISLEAGQPFLYTLRVEGLLISDLLTFQRLLARSTFFIDFRRLLLAPTTFYLRLLSAPTAFYYLLPPSTAFHRLPPLYAPVARNTNKSIAVIEQGPSCNQTSA